MEVENKMGPIIPALVSQFRPHFLKPILTSGKMIPQKKEGEHNLRKGSGQSPPKPPWPALPYHKLQLPPGTTVAHPPFPQTAQKPTSGANDTMMVRGDTPWPGAGKMSRNLFEERNWVLPKDYLAIEGKKEDATVAKPPLKEEHKMGEQTSQPKGRNMWLGTQLSLL